MTKVWSMMLRICRACLGEILSSKSDGICVRVALVVVVFMVAVGVVVLMVAVGVVVLVGVLFIRAVEMDFS